MTGLLGIAVLLAAAYLICDNRKAIRWRTVGAALAIQISIGFIVFAVPAGREALQWLSDGVTNAIGAGKVGVDFLFGPLTVDSDASLGFVFAFRVLPMIIFFSSLIAVLYHLKVMAIVIKVLGGGLKKLLGTSRTESLSAAANIFVGQTEAPLVVKPYISRMTSSELFAVMVGGLASVAGSILAGYVALGVDIKYLIAASFMAAPGGLLYAKMMKPETEVPEEKELGFAEGEDKPANAVDAAAIGASTGLKLALNVGAMLLAFIGLIALCNVMLGGVGGWFGYGDLSLQQILGWMFAPLAWLIGMPWQDAVKGGGLIGQKLILNEFVAYVDYIGLQDQLTTKARAIGAVALCGFANLSSIGILLGGLGVMAPNRRSEIAKLGFKAVVAGTFSNLTSAAIVGLFVA
ncbi:MAG: NupC/NupG family nucleoside CNT transporter [Akkermansiaceae bacterium]|jgi:concentrative nucleoside transporter, CNT family|nr:NupC/NupG family nucleoside CNT transporter [Akkermansiaceae bacterium]MDP4648027.1 NupC/NupG family nucleoside CNT transporter [Akkermansiaceae bacterium]MDP4720320.1 NupC/NupG family nucleoside CNT transporter [Akkermansiaceae bacterium]MDP4781375.1 NupC/NupG family nucleoside CNT transporter [Akkermansiaceae bacterium]MDP4848694.1 NupC/NupG family nucleoside CNT transporter [Akkermansiaceae bacterium]